MKNANNTNDEKESESSIGVAINLNLYELAGGTSAAPEAGVATRAAAVATDSATIAARSEDAGAAPTAETRGAGFCMTPEPLVEATTSSFGTAERITAVRA